MNNQVAHTFFVKGIDIEDENLSVKSPMEGMEFTEKQFFLVVYLG